MHFLNGINTSNPDYYLQKIRRELEGWEIKQEIFINKKSLITQYHKDIKQNHIISS